MSQVRTSPVLGRHDARAIRSEEDLERRTRGSCEPCSLDEVVGVVEANQAVVTGDGQGAPIGAELREDRVAELERLSNLAGLHVDDVDASPPRRRRVRRACRSGRSRDPSTPHPRAWRSHEAADPWRCRDSRSLSPFPTTIDVPSLPNSKSYAGPNDLGLRRAATSHTTALNSSSHRAAPRNQRPVGSYWTLQQ